MDTPSQNQLLLRSLWFLAIAGTLYLSVRRYQEWMHVVPNGPIGISGDFWTFLHASRAISAGHSPYNFSRLAEGGGYVYSPLIAVLLLPFCHAGNQHIWQAWIALSIIAVVVFGVLVTWVEAPALRAWRRPVFLGFVMITAFQFMPTSSEFSNGQTDIFVLVMLAAAVLASERGRAAASGALIGVAALIKSWPLGAAVSLFRRGYVARGRVVIGLILTLLIAPIIAVLAGGTSELVDFLRVTVDARTQKLVNFSVWGIPKALFTNSGVARPELVSTPLRWLLTVILAACVIGLLVMLLHWSDSKVLSFWNATACVILLLPVSHFVYTMFWLPILWIWAARWLAAPRLNDLVFVVSVVMGIWWIITFNFPMIYGFEPPSGHFAITFFANLVALAVSVIGDHVLRLRSEASAQTADFESSTI
jgi:alpha-1,2-mannosyltransferase